MDNKTVAMTMLEQLGGKRFMVMTGAKNFTYGDRSLNFKLPSNFAKDGINAVRIELMPSDTYTVTFMKVRGHTFKTIATVSDVYCDMLQDVFVEKTGLLTKMFGGGAI